MDLYNIYSVIKYKYAGVTDERNVLAVDYYGQLHHHLPYLGSIGGPSGFILKQERSVICLS
jgi:hypothetical protein